MPTRTNRRIVLASRPEGAPKASNFRLEQSPPPEPRDGQVLLRTLWLSLDPYMRGRMSAARSYAKPVEVGEPMVGGTVNEVVASKHPDFKPGDVVLGYAGWQDYAVSDGAGLRKLDARRAPVSTALGVLGMPGMTAYTGLLTIGQPKGGENVGGAVWDAVSPLLNDYARIPVCGLIAQYNMTELPGGPDRTPQLFRQVLTKRLTIRGFIVSDFASQAEAFGRDAST